VDNTEAAPARGAKDLVVGIEQKAFDPLIEEATGAGIHHPGSSTIQDMYRRSSSRVGVAIDEQQIVRDFSIWREDHVLTVFMEQKSGAKFSYLPYALQVRRRGNWSATTPNPTSTTQAKILKSGAPVRSARSAGACEARASSDHFGSPQARDFIRAKSELGEQLLGLLAEFRRPRRHPARSA